MRQTTGAIRPPTAAGPRLVLIEWVDSHRVEGWHSDDPATEPLLCRSVGWLVHDGDTAKTIAPHVTAEEPPQRCGELTIPVCCIREIRPIRVGGRRAVGSA